MSVGPHNPFFKTPYGDIGGKNVGGRPKKVKTTFAPLKTAEGGFTMPDIEPEAMKTVDAMLQLPTNLQPTRARALQTRTNKNIATGMANSKNVRNSR